ENVTDYHRCQNAEADSPPDCFEHSPDCHSARSSYYGPSQPLQPKLRRLCRRKVRYDNRGNKSVDWVLQSKHFRQTIRYGRGYRGAKGQLAATQYWLYARGR